MKLIVKQKFCAAHMLNNYEGVCGNLHGHTWLVEVEIAVPDPNTGDGYYEGVTIDFKEVKEALRLILPDHQCINDWCGFNPTAENLALYFKDMLVHALHRDVKVTVWESDDCAASV